VKVLILDTETTDFNGYALEFCCILAKFTDKSVKVLTSFASAFDPQVEIPPQNVRRLRLNPEALVNFPKFGSVWKTVELLIKEADLIVGHNVSFDLKILRNELRRLGTVVPSFSYKEINSFCTCTDTYQYLYPAVAKRFGKKPRLSRLARELRIQRKLVSSLAEKICKENSYSPETIRTEPTRYYNAVQDAATVYYAFRRLLRKRTIQKVVRERLNNKRLYSLIENGLKLVRTKKCIEGE